MTFHQTAQPGKVIESGNSLLQSANRYTSDKREKTPKTCSCSSASFLKLKGNRSGTFINYLAFIYYCGSRVGHRNWFNKIDWSLGEYVHLNHKFLETFFVDNSEGPKLLFKDL